MDREMILLEGSELAAGSRLTVGSILGDDTYVRGGATLQSADTEIETTITTTLINNS
eukprot:CAMPEP_0201284362 /NCGR_PEP_ID=MMETSP1317-20130820/71444_1 /ASSEMBLY_ACC=CAM_ASM_000770 /TAXON_ID=187299 /ORGANISM="Undescribed Undescribed, Strain Undescribed" /LENGTH=56 /DNA_ID=CAMNT_0047604225 /DNA_START=24 /DNA_END=190 /DNA_ORIENTATION=-